MTNIFQFSYMDGWFDGWMSEWKDGLICRYKYRI